MLRCLQPDLSPRSWIDVEAERFVELFRRIDGEGHALADLDLFDRFGVCRVATQLATLCNHLFALASNVAITSAASER